MIDPNIDGIVPNERLRDMRRDLRSHIGGGLGGVGPRGEGVFLVDDDTLVGDGPYTVDKSAFQNPTGKASYGIRIGDVVIFSSTSLKTGADQLCTGLVTAISGDVVTFAKHAEITTEGFSPTISVSDIAVGDETGHHVTITNKNGQLGFDVMDGAKGDKGDAFEFSDLTNEQLDGLRSDVASVYYRKQETSLYTSPNGVSRITIPFSSYVPTDMLFVDVNGLSIIDGIDYVIDDNEIVLSSPLTHSAYVNFKLLTAVALTQQDLDSIVTGAIIDDVANIVINDFADDFAVATHTNNGLMSSSDKIKLDEIITLMDDEIDEITGQADISQRFVPLSNDEIDTITR